jgi:nucleoside-diphosphate-sugar epimerase
MGEKVFVTGASGRLGIPLVRRLAQSGWEVQGLARTDAEATVVREAGAAACLVGDIWDVDLLVTGCQGSRGIVHLAGTMRGPGRETADRVNAEGAACLVEAVARSAAKIDSLVFSSSWAIYGDRSGLWVHEDFIPSPNTRYGRSKVAAEACFLEAFRRDGLPVVIGRLAMVYGRGHPFLLEDAIRSGRAVLPGEGQNYVPLVHETDAVDCLVLLLEKGLPGRIYNVAGLDRPTLAEFYAAVADHVGGRPPRFWSTFVPSYVQLWTASANERLWSRLLRTPLFTPDMLRTFCGSVRLKTDRIEKELGFSWRYPDIHSGLATLGPNRSSPRKM